MIDLHKKRLNSGFTLIELMVVLVIIGILMAYAIPSYQRQVIRSKRTKAQDTLMEIAAAQERHKVVFGRYATTLVGAENATVLNFDPTLNPEFDSDYTATLVANANTFTISSNAKPGSTQVKDTFDGNCAVNMGISSAGVKTPLSCWQ